MDLHFDTELAEVLDEIIGERVVIIEDEEHGTKGGRCQVGGDACCRVF